jgi:hypothetical protein
MTDYTKTTDFAAKDSLPSGDSGKIIKGTEFETEFDNIATAVATKSNIASPTFTGTTTIPTVDINGGAIDGTTVGAASASTGAFTTLTASTSLNIASSTTVDGVLDEDNMASDSASKLATQQSIKAYVDSQIGANNELSEVLSNGNTTGGTDIAVGTGDDITFADSSKAIFGAGSDLEIYHDGGHSRIKDVGTGSLVIGADDFILQDAAGTENKIVATTDGSVTLSNNGSTKLATTSTGIDVTGTVTFGDGHTIGDDSFDNLVIASSTAENIILNANDAGVTVKGDTQFLVETEFGTDRFKVDTSTGDISFYDGSGNAGLFWDASAESLGIGTTSPDRPLHIAGNPAMLLLEDTGGAADDKRAQLQVDSGVFEINSRNDDNSSRVDNIFIADLGTGNIGIGTVSPSAKLDTAYTDSATYSSTSPSADLILSRKNTGNTANETVGIRFDVGWSGSTTGGAAIEAIQPSNASTADLAFLTRDAGTWGERMRIDSSGHAIIPAGVTLGTAAGTYNADNTLDDYEEGTWTPTLPNGGTLTVEGATYTKIGRLVNVRGYIQDITPTANTSQFQIGGLPFTTGNTAQSYGAGSISFSSVYDASGLGILNRVNGNSLYFHYIDGTSGSSLTNNNWISTINATSGQLIFQITYYT